MFETYRMLGSAHEAELERMASSPHAGAVATTRRHRRLLKRVARLASITWEGQTKRRGSRPQTRVTSPFQPLLWRPSLDSGGYEGHQEQKEKER